MSDAPAKRKRVKWEPAAAMVAVLIVGIALVLAPGVGSFDGVTRDGATLHDFQAVHTRGRVEVLLDPASGEATFRVLTRERGSREVHASDVMDAAAFRSAFGERTYSDAISTEANWAFRLLKITSWASLAWVAVGFGGQLAFSGRMLVQWFVSEKQRQSTVPEAFWWMSLIGGMMLFAYFAWRQELVGVIGQTSGLVIYARNIRLIYKQRRRERRNGAIAEAV
ncbi:MAG: lipid-A-disaccharide synthase N-terminal domain-containing protein [Phycisphaeraceae bacterium]|nr:lipid-A-disaccharide synthase N-terminal domain-containing protein [Phycisphaeraceae bacterium]